MINCSKQCLGGTWDLRVPHVVVIKVSLCPPVPFRNDLTAATPNPNREPLNG